jgi:hypothetical protein
MGTGQAFLLQGRQHSALADGFDQRTRKGQAR